MLKLKRFDEGVWFDYSTSIRFKIRAMTPKKLIELREKSRRDKSFVSGEITEQYDGSILNTEIFRWMIEEWRGIEFDGNPSPEECKDIIFNHLVFRDFITDKSYELFRVESARVEDELKNSDSSQGGSQKREKPASGATNAERHTKS